MELVRSYCPIRGGPPTLHGGRAPALIVSRPAQRSLHVTACMLAKSPNATLYTGGSDGFVSSTAAPIASGWSEPSSRAGLSPAVDQRLFTAHVQWGFTPSDKEASSYNWWRMTKFSDSKSQALQLNSNLLEPKESSMKVRDTTEFLRLHTVRVTVIS